MNPFKKPDQPCWGVWFQEADRSNTDFLVYETYPAAESVAESFRKRGCAVLLTQILLVAAASGSAASGSTL